MRHLMKHFTNFCKGLLIIAVFPIAAPIAFIVWTGHVWFDKESHGGCPHTAALRGNSKSH